MRPKIWLTIGTVSLMAVGCSNNEVVIKRQMEMEARLEQLVQGHSSANARLTECSNEVKDLQAQVKKNSADIEEMRPGYQELKSSIDAVSKKVAEAPPQPVIVTPAPTPKIEVVNKDASPEKDAGPQDAYIKAFGLFSANNYKQAIEAFESFIKAYPENEYAGNAQYWIGESYYTQREFKQALDAFNKVVTNYPKGKKVPDAMLKIGFTLISLNEPAKAKETLQSLIDKYPKSQAAVKAKERLNR